MKNNLTFIHAADLHLDSPFKGLSAIPEPIFSDVVKSTFTALDRLVAVAIERDVSFILLTGDLFDNERKSLKAQIHLRNAFEKLKHHDIDVFLSYGNHDYINGNVHQIEYPENVLYFRDEEVRQITYQENGEPLAAIYGFSYENQAVKTNKSLEYNISDDKIPFHIAMLHGSLASNTDHDTYAPFQLSDLTKKGFDYWALGHIHQRQVLSDRPPVVYPGNTQGRHRKESSEKGCYHVTLTETNVELSFIPLQSIMFNGLTVDVSDCSDVTQLEATLKATLETQFKSCPQLIHLTLQYDTVGEQFDQYDISLVEELIEVMNDIFMNNKNWLYIYRFNVLNKGRTFNPLLLESDHFIGELAAQLKDSSIDPYLNDLYHHRQARKYLDSLSAEEMKEISEEAYELLISELLN